MSMVSKGLAYSLRGRRKKGEVAGLLIGWDLREVLARNRGRNGVGDRGVKSGLRKVGIDVQCFQAVTGVAVGRHSLMKKRLRRMLVDPGAGVISV